MKHLVISGAVIALALVAAQPTQAANSSKEEATGVGAGAIIGAVAGGPPGAIIGAALGGLIGDRYHDKKQTITQLDSQLTARNSTIDSLSGELVSQRREAHRLRKELTLIDNSGVRELHVLLNEGLTFTVPYRTAEDTLPIHIEQRLTGIASLLSSTPGVTVQIDGYADPRGGAQFNSALSLARADNVKALLISAGLDEQKIEVFGHGETTALQDTQTNADQLALERRVTVTFYREQNTATGVAAAGTDQ